MIQAIKFKDFKRYLSVVDRLSIVRNETTEYENYHNISEVPDIYDELYVWGVGHIESDFTLENDPYAILVEDEKKIGNNMYYGQCIEVRVSEQPRFNQKCEKEEIHKYMHN